MSLKRHIARKVFEQQIKALYAEPENSWLMIKERHNFPYFVSNFQYLNFLKSTKLNYLNILQ
jgi:hypothetical protein